MQERSQNLNFEDDESDNTLDTPRFDADEARHAHPVVPLDEVRAATRTRAGLARLRDGARRNWPLSLIVVALLAIATLGGIATKVLRRNHAATPVPVSADSAQTPPQTNATPPQTDATAREQTAPAPPVEEKSETRAPLHQNETHAARADQAVEIPAPREVARDGRKEVEGEVVERRGHARVRDERDARDTDKEEKDSRKAPKHPKKGEARLVDVLV